MRLKSGLERHWRGDNDGLVCFLGNYTCDFSLAGGGGGAVDSG